MRADDHRFYRPIRAVHRCGLTLDAGLEAQLHALAAMAHPRETGGLLLGWWQHRVPVVIAVVEVADPNAGRNRWTRDETRATQALERVRRTFPAHVGYVGEWHSHPADVGPSMQDVRAIRRACRKFDEALVLAVVRHGGRIDTRLAHQGRLTTVSTLTSARPSTQRPSGAQP